MQVELGFGAGVQNLNIPDQNLLSILTPNPVEKALTGEAEVRRALENPIGTPCLKEIVKPGEKIPLDGVVLLGESMVDTRALTGESVPKSVRPMDEVLSGCINESGVLTIQVSRSYEESTVARIIDMVENASSRKAPTENFITKFARYYTPAVVVVAMLLGVLPPLLLGGGWSDCPKLFRART